MKYLLPYTLLIIFYLFLIYLGYRLTRKSSNKKRITLIVIFALVPSIFYILENIIPTSINSYRPISYQVHAIMTTTLSIGLPLIVGIVTRIIKEHLSLKKHLNK